MRNAITILDEAIQAQLAAKVYRHIVMLAKSPAQAFADLHERKRKHAENRAKHPPKPKRKRNHSTTKTKQPQNQNTYEREQLA